MLLDEIQRRIVRYTAINFTVVLVFKKSSSANYVNKIMVLKFSAEIIIAKEKVSIYTLTLTVRLK